MSNKGVSWWTVEDGDQIFYCGSEAVCASQLGEGLLGKPSKLIDDAGMAGSLSTYHMALVTVHCGAHMPVFNGMVCPCVTKSWLGMGVNFYAWRGDWVMVKVNLPMDAFPGRQLRGDPGAS